MRLSRDWSRPRVPEHAAILAAFLLSIDAGVLAATVSGPRRVWQTLTIDFDGPVASETDNQPNPFLDYRLSVRFIAPGNAVQVVPGFFAGDGEGGGTGGTWRVLFTPDRPGTWRFVASFREGDEVAISFDPQAGSPTAFDGELGLIDIDPRDLAAPGFLRDGRLEYVGGHHLKQRDGGYWLKGGADSPENLLGYSGIDNTPEALHDFAPHVADWAPGDPDWDRTDPPGTSSGRGLIGALNYLASVHVNSVYFMPMNVGGDAQDTWPFVGPIDNGGDPANDDLHYDLGKLHQWEIVLAHAQRLGIHLHVVLNEAEPPNKLELDDATLGVERKLFYRELVARFGHHNALQWNISEEYDHQLPIDPDTIKELAAYITAIDPYDHPITVHNVGPLDGASNAWTPFLGDDRFDLTSFQLSDQSDGLGGVVEDWRQRTADAGRPLPIMIDEPEAIDDISFDEVRKRMIWDVYLSGGGAEWLVRTEDITLEDFRQYEQVFVETWHARRLLEENVPFWTMEPADGLVSGESPSRGGAEVLARPGFDYVVYFPEASSTGSLDLAGHARSFEIRWFDPRSGVFVGDPSQVQGGGAVAFGAPPGDPGEDWAVLVTVLCTGDVDGDGTVGTSDLITLLGGWGPCPPGACPTDLDGDGAVGASDLLILLADWGACGGIQPGER